LGEHVKKGFRHLHHQPLFTALCAAANHGVHVVCFCCHQLFVLYLFWLLKDWLIFCN